MTSHTAPAASSGRHRWLFRALGLAAVLVTALAGCANPERSRDWSNPGVAGQVLAQQVCSNCHGLHGESSNPMTPKLAGQNADYLEAELIAIRDRDRNDARTRAYMWGPTRSLTNQQIHDLAQYYSGQDQTGVQTGTEADREAGRSIYYRGIPARGVEPCAKCHGQFGQGEELAPRLAGQNEAYLRNRTRPAMVRIAARLSNEDIANIASYMASVGTGAAQAVPLPPSEEKLVRQPALKIAPPPDSYDAHGDPSTCKYSVWTAGWYCGEFWPAFSQQFERTPR